MSEYSLGEEARQGGGVPQTISTSQVAQTWNRIYNSGNLDEIQNVKAEGFRVLKPHRGFLIEFVRLEEYVWSIRLWDVLQQKDYVSEPDMAMFRLILAVWETSESQLLVDHEKTIRIEIQSNKQVGNMEWTAEEQTVNALREAETEVEREYQYRDILRGVQNLSIVQAGGAVPFQAEGTIEGYPYYFRYRGGHASLRVSSDEDNLYDAPHWAASMEYGDMYDGSLTTDEFAYLFCTLVLRLRKAEYRYTFYHKDRGPNHTVEIERDDGTTYTMKEEYHGWGLNPWDARKAAILWAKKHREIYGDRVYWMDVELSDLVTNDVDTRVFPDKHPDFRVLEMPKTTEPRQIFLD